ncbi:MAG: OsmC family protein [Anaerolineaceae bacterium]|nr:OsmC family protein [Anaerolineaceae bacterium]
MEMKIDFPGGARVNASFGPHTIITDQDGSAPSPFSTFLASLGTCAGIYVLGFCQQRRLPTEGIQIIQRIRQNPFSGMIDKVDMEIQVPPTFPERYHEALVRSANLCAVKKHMETPPQFDVYTKILEPAAA